MQGECKDYLRLAAEKTQVRRGRYFMIIHLGDEEPKVKPTFRSVFILLRRGCYMRI